MPVTITASSVPPWKAELLQKRAEKLKVDHQVQGWMLLAARHVHHSVVFAARLSLEHCSTLIPDALPDETKQCFWQNLNSYRKIRSSRCQLVPEWKRQLLQRLHEKTEAVRIKMAVEARKVDDQMVLNEPILKVSDNIFKRKELERKLSGGQVTGKKLSFESSVSGHRVIRKDKMVIIEKTDDEPKFDSHNGEIHEYELPNAGIVSRLRGKFSSDDRKRPFFKPLETRSKSSDDILNLDNEDFPPSPLSPADDYSALSRNFDRMKPLPQDRQNKRYSSVDGILTHDADTPEPFRKTTITFKKFNAPSSPTKKQQNAEDEVDMTSLHSPGSTPAPVIKLKPTEKPVQPQQRPKLSDRTQEFTKDMGSLHASSNFHKNADEISLTPETLTLTPAPTIPPVTDRLKHPESTRPKDGANDVTKLPHTARQDSKTSHSDSNHTVAHNKENIPELPKRRNLPITRKWSKTGAEDKASPMAGGGQIIELGRISMDSSLLKSKAAIAANEIMKESRTIMIVPRGRNKTTASKASAKSTKAPKNDVIETKTMSNGDVGVRNPPKTSPVVATPTRSETLPTSSVDDVIMAPSQHKPKPIPETNSVPPHTKQLEPDVKSHEKQWSETKAANKPEPRAFVVSSSSGKKVDTSRSNESNAVVNARFGSKLSSSAKNKPSFGGGKSFVIDPSKFKKSSAQPLASNAATKQTQVQNGGSTRVISPKTQTDASSKTQTTPIPTNEEGSSTPKGKRKLTADQIVVIGGYVKLGHSSLAKPNKLRKGVHVKFEESQLESIYQYPSESSLLNEDQQSKLNQRMTSLGSKPGLSKGSSLDEYTPKYLLAMKESLNVGEDEKKNERIAKDPLHTNEVVTDLLTPLADTDAEGFSASTDSSDLLF